MINTKFNEKLRRIRAKTNAKMCKIHAQKQ